MIMKPVFQSIQDFSADELNLLDNLITCRTLKQEELLLAENQVCNEIVFIEKGILRFFFVNHKGDEKRLGKNLFFST